MGCRWASAQAPFAAQTSGAWRRTEHPAQQTACTAGNRGRLRILWADGRPDDEDWSPFAALIRLECVAVLDMLGDVMQTPRSGKYHTLRPDSKTTVAYDVVLFTEAPPHDPRGPAGGGSLAKYPWLRRARAEIGKLIDEATGWPVAVPDEPEAYAEALRRIVAAPGEAQAARTNIGQRAASQYSWQAYLRLLGEEPGFLGARRPTLTRELRWLR